MKNPPIQWEDLYAMGLPLDSSISYENGTISVSNCSQIVKKLIIYCANNPPPEDKMSYLRHIRDALMSLSDWTQMNDVSLSESKRQEWASYRQSLRDLPAHYNNDGPIPWPIAPE